jgi:hypothetical protein
LGSWWLAGWSGRVVASQDQDDAGDDAHDADADAHLLQWPKATPLARTDDVHADDAGNPDQGQYDDDNAQLALGDHTGRIIAQWNGGATLRCAMRIVR